MSRPRPRVSKRRLAARADLTASAAAVDPAAIFGGAAPVAESRVPRLSVERLVRGREDEVLAFLSTRPEHTVVMSSYVLDNGLESPLNRGDFYSCRDARGRLRAVALFGHAALFESRADACLVALARHARNLAPPRLFMGEAEKADLFWSAYADGRSEPAPRVEEALLYQLRPPVSVPADAPRLRRATLADAELVAAVHAEMAYRESGVNPLAADRDGFMLRTARRIARGRCWVCTDAGRLNFKADVVSETPEVIYLEGVYVTPEERGRGFGTRCLARLASELLAHARSLVLLVNPDNAPARALYERAGFTLRSRYHMIYPRARDGV